MRKISAARLETLMNEYGSRRAPFLFGVDYERKYAFFVDNPLTTDELLWQVEETGNAGNRRPPLTVVPCMERKDVFSLADYTRGFDVVQAGLRRGDSFLANLTYGLEVTCNVDFETLFHACKAKYKLLLPDEFVCFSPESFVKIAHNEIRTYPMKGTIDATIADAERILLDNYKEQCEHNTIVDLMRNDLSRVAERVRVARFRYVDRIATQQGEMLQTSSEIVGRLAADWHAHLGDLIFQLLPAGSICGAPKEATCNLIARAEIGHRGWYTGVFGYYDGEELNTAVMIRCLARRNGKLFFHSGGGITANSNAADEYNELLTKITLPIG